MQPDLREHYQLARQRCLRRVENTLVWVFASAMILIGLNMAFLQNNQWLQLTVVAVYAYLWLPIVWVVVMCSLIAWAFYSVKLLLMRP